MPITTPSKEHGAAANGDEGKRFEEQFTFLSLRPPVGVVVFFLACEDDRRGFAESFPACKFSFSAF